MLEVQTTGRFFFIQWLRNADPLFLLNNAPNFVQFGEIFYQEVTTTADLGQFEAVAESAPGAGQIIPRVEFNILSPSTGAMHAVYSKAIILLCFSSFQYDCKQWNSEGDGGG